VAVDVDEEDEVTQRREQRRRINFPSTSEISFLSHLTGGGVEAGGLIIQPISIVPFVSSSLTDDIIIG